MMTSAAFLVAVLALLLAPGPTNTLIGLAGAQAGMRRVTQLIPAELSGYLTAILPLAWLGAEVFGQWPLAAIVLRIVAGLWVLLLAFRLWSLDCRTSKTSAMTARKVYLTTVLNPKALILGLVLLPAPDSPQFIIRLALFCLVVIGVAVAWGIAGSLTRAGSHGRVHLVQRVASVWLTIVSGTLIAGALPTS